MREIIPENMSDEELMDHCVTHCNRKGLHNCQNCFVTNEMQKRINYWEGGNRKSKKKKVKAKRCKYK
jgi:hypothetical protein